MRNVRRWPISLALVCVCLLHIGVLQAEPIFETKEGGLALKVERSAEELTLAISANPPAAASKSESSVVTNPTRLVIDLFGLRVDKNHTYALKAPGVISQIRLGTHPDKLRVVLDLVGDSAQVLEENLKDGDFKIKFRLDAAAEPPLEISATAVPSYAPTASTVATIQAPKLLAVNTRAKAETPTFVASATPTHTPSPSASATTAAITASATTEPTRPAPSATATSTPAKIPTKTAEVLAQLPVVPSTLKAIDFIHLGTEKVPVVKLSLSQLSQFKLVKKDERSFEISIPESTLGSEALALPQFPPHDFFGFSVVQARNEARSVRVSIGVERGMRVGSVNKGNDILIRMLNR